MTNNKPLLVVGLGNPGEMYEKTRHNIGFMFLDRIPNHSEWLTTDIQAQISFATYASHNLILVKPLTGMNNSGIAVKAMMEQSNIPLENVIVIHDDMDIKLGEIRQKIGGSSAGHNGIKSIDNEIGTEYTRIRIGIDHPKNINPTISVLDWVLGNFSNEEYKIIDKAINNLIWFNQFVN